MTADNQEQLLDFMDRARRAQAAVDRLVSRSPEPHVAQDGVCLGRHCDEHAPPRPRGLFYPEVSI